ncbi:MAG: PAS domain-containing sensor histidine kinase [Prolixibacteraceae bacterium]|nr:PAS domain-containing sensor histidine kinase [Prolixibacteraceae bacterium]
MLFSDSNSRIVTYGVISLITILILLHKSNTLFNVSDSSFSYYNHPVSVFLAIFSGTFILTYRHKKLASYLYEEISLHKKGVSKIFRDSELPAVVIRSDNDEEGNILKLIVENVNNAFESAFSINNYEIKNQEANFIFDLVMKEHIDLNNILLFSNRKPKEISIRKLDRWYKINVIQPYSNKFYVILEDITKIKRKTAELEYSKQRYKVLLEAIPDIFFVIDKEGIYEDFVIKESDLFKIEDTNIIGNSIFDVGFPENMAEKIYQCIQNCLNNNTIEVIEYSLKTPNGTYIFEMRLAKLNSGSVISVARDITRRKNAEFSLEKAKRRAEESDRLKSVFLTNLSHEIRTPLNIIINFTRMLVDNETGTEDKTEITGIIQQNGTQLLNMINNTIHLSEIETGSVSLSLKFCGINTLIREIYNQFIPLIPDGRDVKMRLSADVPNPAFGFVTDQNKLKEILIILLDNAVKYTLSGEITIGYEIYRTEVVKFIVSDTGIGIPEEEQKNIFSRFYRINNEINDITSGSGIGLSIARHYITMLGGELNIESEQGKGTTASFSLPFKEGQGYLRVVS